MRPDVCVVDISMPGICGIDAAAELKARGSSTEIVMLTGYEDLGFLAAALESDATGYVVKSRIVSDLSAAIHEAFAGRRFVSPSLKPSIESSGVGRV